MPREIANNTMPETKRQQSIIDKYKNMNTSDTIAFYQLVASIVGGAIGIGLFAFTIFTFLETLKANAISQKNYELAKESYDSSSKQNAEILALEKANAKSQIDAMKEQVGAMKAEVQTMREQFILENTAYLDIVPMQFININDLRILYKIINLGKYPIKVIEVKQTVTVAKNIPDKRTYILQTEQANFYLSTSKDIECAPRLRIKEVDGGNVFLIVEIMYYNPLIKLKLLKNPSL